MSHGMRFIVISALLGSLVSCILPTSGSDTTTNVRECALDVTLSPTEAHVGDVVQLLGGPFTQPDDTIVRVAGVTAALGDSVPCALCDACVVREACVCAGACATCDDECADCTPTLAFTVPDVAPGVTSVVLVNSFGATGDLWLTVLPAPVDTDVPVDTDTDVPPDTDTDTP